VPTQFNGLLIEWEKHLKIEITYNSGFKSKCFPVFYAANSSLTSSNSLSIGFNANGNPWGYIRCSVDLTQRLFFTFDENLVTSEEKLLGSFSNITTGDTTLVIKGNDSNVITNQGAIYIRHLRLWKCYLCQDADTYRLDITNISAPKYTNLLHIFEAPYIDPEVVKDVKANTTQTLTLNTNWIGNNVFDLTNYSKLTNSVADGNGYLCNEYKDVCSGLLKLNQVENVIFTGIQPPMNNRFTIEFWALNTNNINLDKGLHIIWKNVGSVSLIRDLKTTTTLNTYCWPQDHKLDLLGSNTDTIINNLSSTTLNYDLLQTTSANNKWVWVRCAVNFTNREFYMNENTTKQLKPDLVYGDINNDLPFRYLWQNNETSYLIIAGASLNSSTDINIRSIYLFNEYLPKDYLFKNR